MTIELDNIVPFSAEEVRMMPQENADLWAMSHGFSDAADMKAEGDRMERHAESSEKEAD